MWGYIMSELIVRGRKRLAGKVVIQGSKNSTLPILAATILAKGKYTICNCPEIIDVRQMLNILENIGIKSQLIENTVSIDVDNPTGNPDYIKCKCLRASSLLMGALLGRNLGFSISFPGGCNIGARPLDYHLDGFRALGAEITQKDNIIYGKCKKLVGCSYTFPYPSVGALENMLLAGVCAEGVSEFTNCARDPEIIDLCNFLRAMGADIEGDGTGNIVVRGGRELSACDFEIPGDRIVAGTYMIACAAVGGNIVLSGIEPGRLRMLTRLLKKTGCHVFTDSANNEIMTLAEGVGRSVPFICARPYPEFPTDLQPQMMALFSVLYGSSKIKDDVFDERYGTAIQLARMGADIKLEGDGAYIKGGAHLKGTTVEAENLRQGAALVIAAMAAEGTTIIVNCRHIMRGYEDIVRDMQQLGADIVCQEDEETKGKNGLLPY